MANPDPNEKITVTIVAYERVEYRQQVEMTRADYMKWKARFEDEDADEEEIASQIMDRFIERTDVCDDDDHEVWSFLAEGEQDEEDDDDDAE